MDLGQAVDELYGAAPADFVRVRARLVHDAQQAQAAEVAAELKALRKPTATAWLLNQVARHQPEVISALLALGERMRTAQAKGDGPALTAARPERHEAIESLIQAARECAQDSAASFGPRAVEEVTGTAVAALAASESGQALASGRLLRPLTYAGFGEVELDDAVALLRLVPPISEADEQHPAQSAALIAAEDALRESERELSAARLTHAEALTALEEAAAQVEHWVSAVAQARQRVAKIEGRSR